MSFIPFTERLDQMSHLSENIAALIGSRICHDLISPIGAVNNGLELLALSGDSNGPEIDLVTDSAASANARIRLLRLAFGVASAEQSTRAEEITSAWKGVHAEERLRLEWHASAALPRQYARLVVLACLCVEVGLPQGGVITVEEHGHGWHVSGRGPRVKVDPSLWDGLTGQRFAQTLQPAHVQFLLLPSHLAELGRRCDYAQTDTTLSLRF